MIAIALLLLAAGAPGGAQTPQPLPHIDVTAPKDVTAVQMVNETMAALSRKVTSCVDAGGAAETCRCKYPPELAALRKAYDSLAKLRPEWKDQLLSYHYQNKEGRNISGTLVMQNLRRQLETITCE